MDGTSGLGAKHMFIPWVIGSSHHPRKTTDSLATPQFTLLNRRRLKQPAHHICSSFRPRDSADKMSLITETSFASLAHAGCGPRAHDVQQSVLCWRSTSVARTEAPEVRCEACAERLQTYPSAPLAATSLPDPYGWSSEAPGLPRRWPYGK